MSIKDFHSLIQGGALRGLVQVAQGTRKQLGAKLNEDVAWNEW
ncbi:MAG: hypothetical protein AAGC60_05670 [Acidobacteriota bacterium]